jgi:hypothetical protein
VALSGDGLALNVRLNDIVTFLEVFVLSRKNSPFALPIVGTHDEKSIYLDPFPLAF